MICPMKKLHKLLFLATLLFFAGKNVSAQGCEIIYDAAATEHLSTVTEAAFLKTGAMKTESHCQWRIPVKVWIIRNATGGGGTSRQAVYNALEIVNDQYASSEMEFFQMGDFEFINSALYAVTNSVTEAPGLHADFHKDNVLNLYVVPALVNGTGGALFGLAFPPPGAAAAFITSAALGNGSTLAHEFGHVFSLIHTFGTGGGGCPGSVTPATNELVDGSNCSTTGDRVCDTPADPGFGTVTAGGGCAAGQVNLGSCTYIGTLTDANGALYAPDPTNIMSMFTTCRNQLSAGQLARAESSLNTAPRTNLINLSANAQTHTGTESGWKRKMSVQTVTSTAVLTHTAEVLYESESMIELLPGFEAQWGTRLDAIIGCDVNGADKNQGENPMAMSGLKLEVMPNPVTDGTTFRFSVGESDQSISLILTDIRGNRIQTLFEGSAESDQQHELHWDRSAVAQGVYFVQLQTVDNLVTKKVFVID